MHIIAGGTYIHNIYMASSNNSSSSSSDFLMKASELLEKEESMRHELMESKPYVTAEWVATRVDTELFAKHPRLRYVAGLALGLFIQKR